MSGKTMCRVLFVVFGLLALSPAVQAQVTNLAPNPSFEEDEVIQDDPAWDQWCTWGWEGGLEGRCQIDDTEAIDGDRSLRIEPKGGTSWFYIVLDMPINVTVGKRYTASFWVKAEAPRSLNGKWKATDNSIDWSEVSWEVTTEWAEYHNTAEALNGTVKYEFHCAATDTPFWLDFFNVYEGEYVPGIDPSGVGGGQGKARGPVPAVGAVVDTTQTSLQWRAGKFAALHDVYFGDNLDEVTAATRDDPNVFVGRQATLALSVGVPGGPCPAGLVPGVTYFWRVDEVNDANPDSPWKGDVWSFRVRPLIAWGPRPANAMKYVDPNQDLTWEKGMGTLIFHTIYFGEDADKVQNATTGGWPSTAATYDPGPLQLDKTYFWRVDEFVVPAVNRKGEVWSFTTRGAGGGATARYYKGMALAGDPVLTRTEPTISHNWGGEIVAGLSDGVSARWTANLEAPFTETYKIITSSDDGVRLWFDGRLVIDNWNDHGTMDNNASVNLIAGQVYSIRMEWYDNAGGAVAQLSWESPSLPREIIPQGWLQLPLRAAGPSPANAEPHAPQDATLQWIPGEQATNHDVYFGDDAAAVAAADTTTAGIYKGRQAAAETTFDPGKLEWGKTYWWRVDELNPANPESPWTGCVWSFTTANFIVIDDFESYTDEEGVGARIYETWSDGYSDGSSGSIVGYVNPPFAEQKVVHEGHQSMPLDYNNVNAPFYSEAQREWSAAQNWTVEGVDSLVLYFWGKAKNAPEPLYVTLTDSAGKSATVVHPNAKAVTATQWTEWKIPFASFAGVNPAKIKSLVIGLGDRSNPTKGGAGLLFIDDLRATKP
jgi:hypothetical protein